MDLPLATAWGFGLLLLRTAGLCAVAPVLGARVVPARVRLALALALTWAVHAGAGSPAVAPPAGLAGLAGAALAETATGLLAGLAARWTLDAALAAGHLAGLSAGLGYSALVDPITGAESSAVSQTVFVVAQAVAVALGVHREAVAWLVRSAVAWPPGAAPDPAGLASRAAGQAILSVALAVRLAFPVMAAALLGHLLLAVMGRMAPQLSLSNVGFSASTLAAGLALYLTAPAAAELAARAAVAALAGPGG
ncbi:flagellar biosynthetic protein FliR [Anaeromyxobacter dehalogenans]|uniref:Type III secretion system inner membrane R protein n=1 Tax=Anaeromyxobacter dehalogenans (strain 2CP-C) TaxID=290397 RepID=Q2IQQ2_ANADE|nr:flagellar biosynthetic protein FliR [Anaeromyxobacter dehalogenans]ABC81134.1 type III secretion system inner membrane R protein [Anaeromyxobacter dehalogenans 2CP-C]